jgi:hypothetical protein
VPEDGWNEHRQTSALHQVLVADQPAGLAADGGQVPHGKLHAMLGGSTDIVAGLGRGREFRGGLDGVAGIGAEQQL